EVPDFMGSVPSRGGEKRRRSMQSILTQVRLMSTKTSFPGSASALGELNGSISARQPKNLPLTRHIRIGTMRSEAIYSEFSLIPRRYIAVLVVAALLLPVTICVVAGTAKLLEALNDEAGAALLSRIALGLGLVWVVNLIVLA